MITIATNIDISIIRGLSILSIQKTLILTNLFRNTLFCVSGGEMLLCYFICMSLSVSPLWSYFHPIPDLYANIPAFYSKLYFRRLPPYVATRTVRKWGGGGGGPRGGEETYADFCARLFWRAVYCANPRPDDMYQSNSRYRKGQSSWSPWIMCKYDLATAIVIWLFIHICILKIYLYIFSAMSWLKFVSVARASLPIIPYKERTNREKRFRWLWKWLPWLSLFIFSQLSRSDNIGSNM